MKLILTAAAFACLTPAAAFAQTAPAPAETPAAPAPAASTAKFNLDTPIEALVADEKAKAVLAVDLGTDVTANPAYESFKAMSLRQVQAFAPDKLTDTVMGKIEGDLAAIK
jgi:hypothetical protein